MTKAEALAVVADYHAELIASSTFDEATGLAEHHQSEADAERLWWAIREVQRRLGTMGAARPDRPEEG